MVWHKIDDNFTIHPKWLDVPREQRTMAAALWLYAANWSARSRQDGFVHIELPFMDWEVYEDRLACAESLVKAGLWHKVESSKQANANFACGWLINDWAEYNPLASKVSEKQAAISRKRSESGRKGGKRTQANRQAKIKQTAKQKSTPVPEPINPPTPPLGERLPDAPPKLRVVSEWAVEHKHPFDAGLNVGTVHSALDMCHRSLTKGKDLIQVGGISAKQTTEMRDAIERFRSTHTEPEACDVVDQEIVAFCNMVMLGEILVKRDVFSTFIRGFGSWQGKAKRCN